MLFQTDKNVVQTVFIFTWLALFAGALAIHLFGSPGLKQKMQTRAPFVVGPLFLLFVYLLGGKAGFLFAAAPVALITFLNVRTIKYCSKCGSLNRHPYIYPVPIYCRQCGESLDRVPASPLISK